MCCRPATTWKARGDFVCRPCKRKADLDCHPHDPALPAGRSSQQGGCSAQFGLRNGFHGVGGQYGGGQCGVAIIHKVVADMLQDRLVIRPLETPIQLSYGIIRRRGSQPRALTERLIDCLKESFRDRRRQALIELMLASLSAGGPARPVRRTGRQRYRLPLPCALVRP